MIFPNFSCEFFNSENLTKIWCIILYDIYMVYHIDNTKTHLIMFLIAL